MKYLTEEEFKANKPGYVLLPYIIQQSTPIIHTGIDPSKKVSARYYTNNSTIFPSKEIKRIYSDIDPYGEENWDN